MTRGQRRAAVCYLYKRRYNQSEIAAILECSQGTVSQDIRAIHETWRQSQLDNIEIVRMREIADLDDMERICIERLEHCKDPRTGSRWMEERRKIKERRARLLGLDAAQAYEVRRTEFRITAQDRDAAVLAIFGYREKPLDSSNPPLVAGREVEKIPDGTPPKALPADLQAETEAERIYLDDLPIPPEDATRPDDESGMSLKDRILRQAVQISRLGTVAPPAGKKGDA